MEEIAQVYARALFEVATERDSLDEIRDQLGAFADAMHENRDLAVFFFSPYFSIPEKKQGLERAVTGANPEFRNFLEALIERHRMPAIFRIRTEYDALWDEARKLLPVRVTSAVALDEETVKGIGDRIGSQVDRQIELSSEVDPDILGGIVLRVGNLILDASIKNRLEQLRQQVAQA
ncbi:MAG TPA: ATP synthase F1 subunit delta [Solirubrobacteraceae bacterium]|jgi:F-type H+-transporting ATPase subunit delta|nr:ATP synthase F1 subunit delta [Solirubrobacteraceae bacterium]